MIKGKLTFLGTGGSLAIPVIGCHCPVCFSGNPFNKRMRTSALLQIENKTFLIDCGPDFHEQALKHGIDHLDGVIFTHAHYDHTAGIDELRAFHMRTKQALPCLLSRETAEELIIRFSYIFSGPVSNKLIAKITLHYLEGKKGKARFMDLPFTYFTYEQSGMQVNGFRFGNLAYITDIKQYTPDIIEAIQGVEILILSALRQTPSPIHFSIDDAISFSQKTGAKMTWLTHIGHEVDHETTNATLPANVRLAYDSLEIPFTITE